MVFIRVKYLGLRSTSARDPLTLGGRLAAARLIDSPHAQGSAAQGFISSLCFPSSFLPVVSSRSIRIRLELGPWWAYGSARSQALIDVGSRCYRTPALRWQARSSSVYWQPSSVPPRIVTSDSGSTSEKNTAGGERIEEREGGERLVSRRHKQAYVLSHES